MLSHRDVDQLMSKNPTFEDIICSLPYGPQLPKAMINETKVVIAMARKFNDEVVRPRALELDRRTHEDPDYLPWELVEEANRRNLYSIGIPKLFGGRGYNLPALSHLLEELSSECVGIANVVGVHYLGVAGICASGNTRLCNKIFRDVRRGEKTGEPCIISLAITEPSAGTDVEDVELIDRGNIRCHAKKVKGGYIVNGTKVFISMGHVSTWCMLVAYGELKKPGDTVVSMMVKTGTKGFSFGRHENKMGQRVCPASELVFEDCFIPDENVLVDPCQADTFPKSYRDFHSKYLDYVLCITRPAVCAFATGVARGAYERAVKFASETEVNGELLINQEWAQSMLAEMYRNIFLSRLAYVEGNYANGLYGMYGLLQQKFIYYYLKYTPQICIDIFTSPFLNMKFSTRIMRSIYFNQSSRDQQFSSGLASLAKITGTDTGVKVSQMALEMMGQAGLRQDQGAEKFLRDSKLLQIYEGTNQLNRLSLFKNHIGRLYDQVKMFEEGDHNVG
ncbi:MAG: acyl-CoA dehydrogenase family protein [Acidobacteriota bacterium]